MWPEKSHKILEKWWDVSAFVWGLFKESAKLFLCVKMKCNEIAQAIIFLYFLSLS